MPLLNVLLIVDRPRLLLDLKRNVAKSLVAENAIVMFFKVTSGRRILLETLSTCFDNKFPSKRDFIHSYVSCNIHNYAQ